MKKAKVLATFLVALITVTALSTVCFAAGSADVAGAITSTWDGMKGQIKTIVNDVVFPILDGVLGILLIVFITKSAISYKRNGEFDIIAPAVCLGGLLFVLTAPLYIANVKRGGILLTLIGVGSLYMLNLPRGYSDGFNGWIKQVIALCFTSFMQTTLFFTGLITIQSDWLIGTCLILSATEVPRIADRFGLDTSIRGNMMAVSMTANTALSGMRFIRAVAK